MSALAPTQRTATKGVERMKTLFILLLAFQGFPEALFAKLNVLTTTTTLKSIAESVGGEHIKATSITKGLQDPHFVEAKPSYMVKARRADLIIAVGLELEIGWLPNIIRGSHNPKIMEGALGYFEAGRFITPIEVRHGKVDRSEGDVHGLGNPHFTLDPVRVIEVAKAISKRLSKLDAGNEAYYQQNVKDFEKKINQKLLEWTERVKRTGIEKVITYHKTFNYFLHLFNLKLLGEIEPRPGIPPTAKHILSLVETIERERVSCILVGSFFETNAAERIKQSVPVHIESVPTEVNAAQGATDYEALIETIVSAIENCGKEKGGS